VQTDKLDSLKAEFANADVDILAVTCNVADSGAVKAMVDATVQRFGRVDYAVNCAGISGTPCRLADTQDAMWDKIIAINQSGVYYCMREQLGAMKNQELLEGCVVVGHG
jgi:NAD(P)-dependent dehydrogenase (short-subunit alcohol dehydrogenase family)